MSVINLIDIPLGNLYETVIEKTLGRLKNESSGKSTGTTSIDDQTSINIGVQSTLYNKRLNSSLYIFLTEHNENVTFYTHIEYDRSYYIRTTVMAHANLGSKVINVRPKSVYLIFKYLNEHIIS